ncbi:hypothetical phage protein [Campylobacter phage CPt10]|uniref:YopX protein domain-containing protein n=2 Tax=Firehammervirus CPt10 TaxID=722418 RepID=A0A410T7J0_9CAUD|nr:hypothetical protein APL46_gp064 [Campylobacter phage CPt10]QAU04803.1 hypothetical protein [Campylobacter phage CP20]CBJ94266.1 hypothetical phage protein [Campylobacter phage CPt10]
MKLQDFDFRIWDKHHKGCGNKDCKCQTKYVYGEEAKIRLFEFKEDCEIELWTGFYDKNGKKIYEGDILENEEFEELYLVTRNDIVYNILEISIYRKNIKGQLYKYKKNADISFFKSISSNKYMEIVGNIHEDANLLKEL